MKKKMAAIKKVLTLALVMGLLLSSVNFIYAAEQGEPSIAPITSIEQVESGEDNYNEPVTASDEIYEEKESVAIAKDTDEEPVTEPDEINDTAENEVIPQDMDEEPATEPDEINDAEENEVIPQDTDKEPVIEPDEINDTEDDTEITQSFMGITASSFSLFSGGEGTSANPFLLTTPHDIIMLGNVTTGAITHPTYSEAFLTMLIMRYLTISTCRV